MQSNTITIVLIALLTFSAGYIVAIHVVENTTNTETISEQDYRMASLQYLEDIRNSNDAIIEQQDYFFNQSHN